MSQRSKIVSLQGGLDVVTPPMMVKAGFAIAALNYETEARGYRRVPGYERFDGQRKPSAPEYVQMTFISGSSAIVAGDVITGVTSGATATVLHDAVVDGGSWGDGDAEGDLVMYLLTGAFISGEVLQVSAVTVATSSSASAINAADNDADDAQYRLDVTAAQRARIEKPLGSGPVRGVATYRGDKYCWRDTSDGLAGQMFKATDAGWVAQSFGHIIEFTAATAAFAEGETLTGTTSTATATIERVVLSNGAWDGEGVGYLVLSGITGTFGASEAISTAGGSATSSGVEQAITLPPGGTYRSETSNFYATGSFERLYFVNGVGRAHEWDGTVLSPIRTGLPDALDKPTHLGVQKLHLFLAFDGGSLQNSAIGQPLSFNVLQGAAEIGYGQTITGIKSGYRDSLIVTGRNKVGYITGSSTADFDLKSVSLDSGAIDGTLQIVGEPMFLDDQGLRDMKAVQSYGDWQMGTLTQLVEPLFSAKRQANVQPIASLRVRARDQYRIFYSDGSGFVVYLGRKNPEIMPISLGFTPRTMHSGENADGTEVLLAAGEDGYVYELDQGTSFDGASVEAYLRLAFDHQGFPNVEKRYHRARLEGAAGGFLASISLAADFVSEEGAGITFLENSFLFRGVGGFYDESFWNEFQWSTTIEGQAFADLGGIGESVSIVFISDSATEEPHTLSTLTIFYSPRRKKR